MRSDGAAGGGGGKRGKSPLYLFSVSTSLFLSLVLSIAIDKTNQEARDYPNNEVFEVIKHEWNQFFFF